MLYNTNNTHTTYILQCTYLYIGTYVYQNVFLGFILTLNTYGTDGPGVLRGWNNLPLHLRIEKKRANGHRKKKKY